MTPEQRRICDGIVRVAEMLNLRAEVIPAPKGLLSIHIAHLDPDCPYMTGIDDPELVIARATAYLGGWQAAYAYAAQAFTADMTKLREWLDAHTNSSGSGPTAPPVPALGEWATLKAR
jgi:hypothetical protein